MPLSGPDVLLYEKKGRIVFLTMNRPERMNAFSRESRNALACAWERFDQDEDAWVAILTGAGEKAFCAGRDVKDLDESGEEVWKTDRLRRNPPSRSWKPRIAAINGFALGGGWNLAMTCDLRIAAEHAQFGIPEVRLSQTSEWVWALTREVNLAHALEIVLTGQMISAQRAYDIGFVNKVVPREQLIPEATRWADLVCQNGPMSVRMHKEVIYRTRLLDPLAAEALAKDIFAPLSFSEDIKEGTRAFIEKRKPVWTGR